MTEPAREDMSWETSHGDTVEVFRGEDGKWHWHAQAAGNNEVIGQGEGYERRQDAITGAERHHPPVASGE
jgi:uncharacterized protein YegP (UPF0339 family)